MIVVATCFFMFLFLSGVMAAVDAAVLSVTRPEIEEMVVKGKWGSRRLRLVKQQLTRAVVVIVIVTNTVNVLGPILVSQEAYQHFGIRGVGTVTVLLTLGTILCSEIIPKSLGTHYAPQISRVAAPVIRLLGLALYPLVVALDHLSRLFTAGTRQIGTEEQIRSLVTIGHRAGYIESDEGHLIHRAFVLNDKTAADIMTPLKDVFAVSAGDTVQQAAEKVRGTEYSRYPAFGTSPHDVRGIALRRDILQALADGRNNEPLTAITRPGLTVPAHIRSDRLLLTFRDRHIHLAVVQEGGKTVGVVTLEDVLEELVGEIEDEKDAEDPQVAKET